MAIYLDNNATTALNAQVLDAMLPYMGSVCGNPSSVHRFGRLQRDAIERAREQVASLVGATAEQVIFTSGGTESNNLLLYGLAHGSSADRTVDKRSTGSKEQGVRRLAISAVEHMSVLQPACYLFDKVDHIAVDAEGLVTMESLQQAIKPDTGLVSVMAANNETGVIQPLSFIIGQCQEKGLYFHTDATQAAGKMPLHFNDSGISAMTLSAHKLYGPVGAGALVIDRSLPLKALQRGGSQEKGLRAGTENVAAIVGFGQAAELALSRLAQRRSQMRKLRDYLETELSRIPQITLFAQYAERLSNTIAFGVAGFEGESLLMQLDRKAIAVSSGSACTSGKTEPSHVLQAMGIPTQIALTAIRVSFGETNTVSDVEILLQALADIIETNTHSPVMMAASI